MSVIKSYKIDVPQDKIDLLQKKLALTTFPDELDDSGWDYGAPLADIKRLVDRWQNGYNWREHEAKLNATLPQFTVPISVDNFGTLDIHFVHRESSRPNAIPLLFSHGWPGHFLEVAKLLEGLANPTRPDVPAFHVVAPSLPNYGFSEGVTKKGFAHAQYAETCHKLMLALGYDKYVTQGGDWGYFITRTMGLLYPDHVKASHINFALPEAPTKSQPLLALQFLAQYYTIGLTAEEQGGVKRAEWYRDEDSGYYKEQSTRPQTLGYGQADSPVGLLAWIYEKLHGWVDNYPWTDDEVLTWVSIYAFSRAGPTAASRIYYEAVHDKRKMPKRINQWIPHVKLGVSRFPMELAKMPRLWCRTMGDVVFENDYDQGGHFAAHERPDAIIKDLQTMFGKGGGAYGVVPDKNGYPATSRL